MRSSVKGPLVMAAAMLSFSLMGALVKLAGKQVPSIEVVFVRGLVGLPILIAIARHRSIPLLGTRRGLLAGRGLAGASAMILFFFALTRIPVADAILLNQATPIFVLPLAVLFLKEKVGWKHASLVAIALAGAILVIRPSGQMLNLPGLLALSSALFAAIAYVLVRKLTATEHTLTIVFWFTWISTALSFPIMLPVFVWPSATTWLALGGVGLLALSGQTLLTLAYRHGEAGRLAVIGSTGAIFGAGWDLAIFGHLPDLLTLAGGAIVIASCSAIQLLRHSDPGTTQPPRGS